MTSTCVWFKSQPGPFRVEIACVGVWFPPQSRNMLHRSCDVSKLSLKCERDCVSQSEPRIPQQNGIGSSNPEGTMEVNKMDWGIN